MAGELHARRRGIDVFDPQAHDAVVADMCSDRRADHFRHQIGAIEREAAAGRLELCVHAGHVDGQF